MMNPPRFLIGKLPDGGLAWAAVDPNAHHLQPRVGERRFTAYLAPYPTEEAARQALVAAGAVDIEVDEGRRDKKRHGPRSCRT